MIAAQLIILLLPVVVLIGIGLGIALLGLLQYRLAALVSPQVRVAAAVSVIGIGALLSVALTHRSLDESTPDANELVFYADYAGGFAASRWLTLVLLGAAIVEIIRGALQARKAKSEDAAWLVFAPMMLFYFGTMAVQGLLSEHVGFSYKELYVPIMLMAVYSQPLGDLRLVLSAAKAVVLALLVGSLAGMVVAPDFVIHRPEAGVIPGIDWRLFGLTGHANTLGPVGLLSLILELYQPYRRRWASWLSIGIATAVFVFAQSRTTWAAALLILMLVGSPLAASPDANRRGSQGFGRAVWVLVASIAIVLIAACGLTLFGGLDYLQRRTELGTLNGRFQIWDITLQAWHDNVLFGYGPEVWGAERRLRFNMFHVGQAHNQFIQTLGEAGIVGLVLLLVYLGALFWIAWWQFASSRGLILALLLLLSARCVTESPMRSEGLLSWATFLHVLLLVVACHALRTGSRRRRPALLFQGRAGHSPEAAAARSTSVEGTAS